MTPAAHDQILAQVTQIRILLKRWQNTEFDLPSLLARQAGMPVTRSKRPGIPHRAPGRSGKAGAVRKGCCSVNRLPDPSVACMTSAGRVAQRAELDDLSTKALSAGSVPISA